MNENYLVTKANTLITSNYDLSLEEQRIILTLASTVQPEDEDFKPYKFKISDFMELLGVEDKSKYSVIPKVTKELMKKVFEIENGNKLTQISWLSSAEYERGYGIVELEFSPKLKPFMLGLKEFYTSYKLKNILSLKGKYSIRMYEILKSNEFKKIAEITVDELRKILKADKGSYLVYQNFKNRIIFQAQKELKEKTDIRFEFEEIKTGRKVTSLKFYIHPNKDKAHKNNSASDEIAATVSNYQEEIPMDPKDEIKSIILMMKDHNISALEARKIYNSACGDLTHIAKIYNHFKNKNADNFVALMIKMVKPGEFIEPKKNTAKTKFNNFNERDYDYDELEKKLLGWD